MVASAIGVLAVDNLRLLRMQHQLAVRQTFSKCVAPSTCLTFGSAATDRIVGISLERNMREFPSHPYVEGIVQEQVRQQRRDQPALWRSRPGLDDASARQGQSS